MMNFLKKIFLSIFIFCSTSISAFADFSLIRDAQTENFLYNISLPIFSAANLEDQVRFYIVNDDAINAFVAGGKNIFINTGTIVFADNPLGLIGIIAHETGHISGGHLARMDSNIEQIKNKMALGYILGIATTIFASPEAGQALILGSSHVGEREFYSFSSKHEEAADEAALLYLDRSGISASGLLGFFKEIKATERIYYDTINPYTRTHPLTTNRILRIKTHLDNSALKNVKLPATINQEFKLIKAKLTAFLKDPQEVLEIYDLGYDAGYLAYIIAYHRLGRSNEALELFNKLSDPDDPYILELKGQILYESGKAKEAVDTLLEVEKMLPDEPLIKIELAAAILSMKNESYYDLAIAKLNLSLIEERDNIQAFRFLADLYNKQDNQGLSLLNLAEAELLAGNKEIALKYAKKAKEILKEKGDKGSLLRANDIINSIGLL